MPKYGMTMTEGLIVTWHVAEGDPVEEGQALLTVETEKVNTELESPATGRLVEICFDENQSAAVGAVVAYLETDGA
jgi:pyruvate/2-oxoglutarate dehydrogenase complex dihydrolipoamide acyltransferase (E2) component